MSDERLAAIERELGWIRESVEKINKICVGNGTLGCVAKVNILWYGYAWVIGIAGTTFGTLFGMILSHFFS